jgi:hypothetical protein
MNSMNEFKWFQELQNSYGCLLGLPHATNMKFNQLSEIEILDSGVQNGEPLTLKTGM